MSSLEVGGAKAPVARRRMSVSAKTAGMALLKSDASRRLTTAGEEKDVKKPLKPFSSLGEGDNEEDDDNDEGEEESRATTKGAAMAVLASLRSQQQVNPLLAKVRAPASLKQAEKGNEVQQEVVTEDSINREVKLVEEKKMDFVGSGKIGKIKGLDKLINMNPLPTTSSSRSTRYPPVTNGNSQYNDSLDTNMQSRNANSLAGPIPSAAPTQADLDGFPVIRIDQIPDVNTRMLEASLDQIPTLLKQMHDEARMKQQAVPKFAYYLQKQIDAMRSELMKRAAEKRVFSILEGSSDIFSDYDGIISSSTNEKIEKLRSSYEMKKSAIPEEGPVPAALMTSGTIAPPIDIYPASTQIQQQGEDNQVVVAGVQKSQPGFPYRSNSATVRASSPIEHKSNRSVLSATTRREMASISPSKLSPVAPVVAKDNSLFDVQATSALPNTNDGTLPASPFNAMNYNNMNNTNGMTGNSLADATRGPDRMSVEEKNELMGLNDVAMSMTAKNVAAKVDSNNNVNKNGWGGRGAGEKALQVVYKNFGSEFVVAATEKKRRLFPIKKKTESVDDRREREKKERREAAMKRLMKRKEKIEKDNLRRREQKLIQQAEKMKLRDEQNQAREVEGFFPARNEEKNTNNRARRGKEHASGSVTARDRKVSDEKTARDKKRSRNRTAPASVSVEADEEADESEESVSGGEEELPIEINEQLVDNVKEAICEAVLEESREQRSSPRLSHNNHSPPFNALRHARPPSDDEFEKSLERKRDKKKKCFNARHHERASPRTSPQASPPQDKTVSSPKRTTIVQSKQQAAKIIVSEEEEEEEELESDSQIVGRPETSPSVAKLALAMALSKMEETAKAQVDASSTPSPSKAAVYVQTSTDRLMSKAKGQHMSPIQKLQLNKAKALEKKSRIPRPEKSARGLRALEKMHAAGADDGGAEEGYSAASKSPLRKGKNTNEGKKSPVVSSKKATPTVPALDLSASQILETNMEESDESEGDEGDESRDEDHKHTFKRTDSEALLDEDEIDAKIAALESELMMNGGNRLKREESKKKLQMEIDLMRNAGNSTTFEAKLMVSNIISTALNSPRLSPREYQQEQKELSVLHGHVKRHDTHHDKLLHPHPPQVDLNEDIENKSRAAVDIVRQLKLKRTMSQQKMVEAREEDKEMTVERVDDKKEEEGEEEERGVPTLKSVALATKATLSSAKIVKNLMAVNTVNDADTIDNDGDVSAVADSSQVEDKKTNVRSPRSIREPKISPRVRKPIKAPEKRQPVPLIELRDDVYFCAYGPDELPGLRVWTLEELHDDGSASWDFNMELYFEPPPDNEQLASLRAQRTALRRTVSKGLIILAKDCEPLLRGTQFAQNEEQFTSNWTSALKHFDNQVESMGEAAKDMFSQVDVCGNCHAVCRKLENLIKTYFALMLSNVEEEQNNEAIIEAVQKSISGTNDDNSTNNGGRKSPSSPIQALSVENDAEEYFVTETGMFNKHIHGDDDLLGNRSHETPTPRAVVQATEDNANNEDEDDGNDNDNDNDTRNNGVFLNEAAVGADSEGQRVDGMFTAQELGDKDAQDDVEYDGDEGEECVDKSLTRVKTEEDHLRDLVVLVEDTITKIDDHDHEDVETREYTEMGSDLLDHREDFAEISAAAARAAKDVAELNDSVLESDDRAESNHLADDMALDGVKRIDKRDILAAEEGEEDDDDDDDESMLLPTDVYLPFGGLGDGEDNEDDDGIGYDDDTADLEDSSPYRNNSNTSVSIPGEVDKTLTAEEVYAMEARKERMSSVIEASPIPTINMMPKHSVWYRNKNIPLSPKHASSPNHIDSHEMAITDLYNHIGMIFPVSYSTSGPRNAEHVDARALVECMQQQVHLYNEWMEVMSDYATVFSDDRGISKHGKKEDDDNGSPGIYKGGSQVLHYRVKSSRPEVYDIVTDVFTSKLKHTWEELPQGLGLGVSWNLLWTWSKPRLNMSHLLVWQKVNHFVDSKQLTRKDLLKKNLQRFTDMTGKVAEAFEIMPQTFVLPHEYTALVRTFHEIENSKYLQEDPIQNIWIVKPVGMSRGRGIQLIRDVNDLAYGSQTVVQRYLEHPLLLNGYKFDLRLYVCVTSFKPLEAFIYKEGFARVSTTEYSYHVDDIDNKFIHLTNASIQRENKDNLRKSNPTMQGSENIGGSKIPLHGPHGLWQRLEALDLDVDLIWRNICLCVTKSLVVVDEKMTYQPNCFEVFGFDIILDNHLKPWLLEVNASPSMSRETPLDVRVKNNMIQDTITLIDPAPYDRAAVAKVIKRRLNDLNKNKFNMKSNDPHLEGDLRSILGDHRPRQIGEDPPEDKMGDYQKLCPNTKIHAHVLKLKGKIIKPLQHKA